MLNLLANSVRVGRVTEARPFDARPSFGFPVIDFARCAPCEACVSACPTGAIRVTSAEPGRLTVALSYAACIQCEAQGHRPAQLVVGHREDKIATPQCALCCIGLINVPWKCGDLRRAAKA